MTMDLTGRNDILILWMDVSRALRATHPATVCQLWHMIVGANGVSDQRLAKATVYNTRVIDEVCWFPELIPTIPRQWSIWSARNQLWELPLTSWVRADGGRGSACHRVPPHKIEGFRLICERTPAAAFFSNIFGFEPLTWAMCEQDPAVTEIVLGRTDLYLETDANSPRCSVLQHAHDSYAWATLGNRLASATLINQHILLRSNLTQLSIREFVPPSVIALLIDEYVRRRLIVTNPALRDWVEIEQNDEWPRSRWVWHKQVLDAAQITPTECRINWIVGPPDTGKAWFLHSVHFRRGPCTRVRGSSSQHLSEQHLALKGDNGPLHLHAPPAPTNPRAQTLPTIPTIQTMPTMCGVLGDSRPTTTPRSLCPHLSHPSTLYHPSPRHHTILNHHSPKHHSILNHHSPRHHTTMRSILNHTTIKGSLERVHTVYDDANLTCRICSRRHGYRCRQRYKGWPARLRNLLRDDG